VFETWHTLAPLRVGATGYDRPGTPPRPGGSLAEDGRQRPEVCCSRGFGLTRWRQIRMAARLITALLVFHALTVNRFREHLGVEATAASPKVRNLGDQSKEGEGSRCYTYGCKPTQGQKPLA